MTDPFHRSGADMRPDREPTGIPRWVKVSLIIVAVVGLLIVVMTLIGGGHGPRRHGSPDDSVGRTPPSSVTAGHTPPAGGHR
jgi:hypothetical protein